jgi:hypothetical protein
VFSISLLSFCYLDAISLLSRCYLVGIFLLSRWYFVGISLLGRMSRSRGRGGGSFVVGPSPRNNIHAIRSTSEGGNRRGKKKCEDGKDCHYQHEHQHLMEYYHSDSDEERRERANGNGNGNGNERKRKQKSSNSNSQGTATKRGSKAKKPPKNPFQGTGRGRKLTTAKERKKASTIPIVRNGHPSGGEGNQPGNQVHDQVGNQVGNQANLSGARRSPVHLSIQEARLQYLQRRAQVQDSPSNLVASSSGGNRSETTIASTQTGKRPREQERQRLKQRQGDSRWHSWKR